jgi:hypothetical protein
MSRIEYKNSGIFWQPFIPKSWHVTRLKYIRNKQTDILKMKIKSK